jgi:phytoene dehydrogenase-like protein
MNTLAANVLGTAVLTVALPLLFARLFGKRIVEKWIDTQFSKRLETHKNDLRKDFESYKESLLDDAEGVRAKHQRLLQDFSHYTVKRHEVYARLYRLLRIAHDCTDELNPNYLASPDYAHAELPAVLERLSSVKASKETTKAIATAWFENQDLALTLTRGAMAHGLRQRALRARQRAVNYHLVNELYLSIEVASSADALLKRIAKYQFVCNADVDAVDVDRCQEEAAQSMGTAYRTMVKELRAGDYQESLERDAKNRLIAQKRSEMAKYF